MEIRANLVIAANGAMTLGGTSRALSSHSDRTRFHEIRDWADAIFIGGATARTEPYQSTPHRLFIWSRSLTPGGLAANNPLARVISGELADVLSEIAALGATRLLCEGGPGILNPLIDGDFLSALYITQSKLMGDGAFFNLDLRLQNFHETKRSELPNETFSYLERNTRNT